MPSFDIVSKTDLAEVDNAIQGVLREIAQRFDFKGSKSTLTREESAITILADSEPKLEQLHDLLKTYFVRRKLDPAALDFGKQEKASAGTIRQVVTIKQGIDREISKKIVTAVKGSKTKVQVAIQGDELRVSGKKIDDLQETIRLVKGLGIEQPLQYINMRD
ncbi:YajQ family cyclic di-GMP-binding protein [Zavarzinia sp. CC-PAN008]|uniref:YajQ family cyclic di-GMP-binding protein n=1 Tax=Zavarzinia sp. CC-PAN008 TaxID=3243332 RepID=UPI003F745571